MGKLSLCAAFVMLAACGSDNEKKPDAKVVIPDAPIDSKVFNDAPVDAPPNYDFSCLGSGAGTVASSVTVSGTTETINSGLNGLMPVGSVQVDTCPSSSLTCPTGGTGARLDRVTSDATAGTFTTGNLTTGGTALDAYLKATKTGYRTTYVYPPNPLAASIPSTNGGAPVFMLTPGQFSLITGFAGITPTAGDGTLVIAVVDCQNNPVTGATITVKQGGTDVGMQVNNPMAMGAVLQFNVPADTAAGGTDIGVTYNTTTYPVHHITSFADSDVTTAVRPGY
jgi:hypothetical protein